jgi:UDP-3-O-[3-hydroxymyristoyl] glucosamine N-acyltransferase
MIEPELIADVTGSSAPGKRFAELGLVNSQAADTLTFIDDQRFEAELIANKSISGAFVTAAAAQELEQARPDITLIEHVDPRWAYYSLYNRLAQARYEVRPSRIAASAQVHPSAVVSEHNVIIGERSTIGPNATILADVEIGDDCVVQAGTVIGSDGFEYKRTSRGILFVVHDGVVRIGNHVHVGANTCIDKGFRGRPTLIEDNATIDNLVHIAHSARVGKRSLIIAGTVLGGSTTVGDDVWMSINTSLAPGVALEDGSFVSIGAVVTRRVGAGQQVSGNFAIPHDQFLKLLKNSLATLAKQSPPEK